MSLDSEEPQSEVASELGSASSSQVGCSSCPPSSVGANDGDDDEDEEEAEEEEDDDEAGEAGRRSSLERRYQAAKDEAELLEFKNYELMFKIQELEQNQQRILTLLDATGGECVTDRREAKLFGLEEETARRRAREKINGQQKPTAGLDIMWTPTKTSERRSGGCQASGRAPTIVHVAVDEPVDLLLSMNDEISSTDHPQQQQRLRQQQQSQEPKASAIVNDSNETSALNGWPVVGSLDSASLDGQRKRLVSCNGQEDDDNQMILATDNDNSMHDKGDQQMAANQEEDNNNNNNSEDDDEDDDGRRKCLNEARNGAQVDLEARPAACGGVRPSHASGRGARKASISTGGRDQPQQKPIDGQDKSSNNNNKMIMSYIGESNDEQDNLIEYNSRLTTTTTTTTSDVTKPTGESLQTPATCCGQPSDACAIDELLDDDDDQQQQQQQQQQQYHDDDDTTKTEAARRMDCCSPVDGQQVGGRRAGKQSDESSGGGKMSDDHKPKLNWRAANGGQKSAHFGQSSLSSTNGSPQVVISSKQTMRNTSNKSPVVSVRRSLAEPSHHHQQHQQAAASNLKQLTKSQPNLSRTIIKQTNPVAGKKPAGMARIAVPVQPRHRSSSASGVASGAGGQSSAKQKQPATCCSMGSLGATAAGRNQLRLRSKSSLDQQSARSGRTLMSSAGLAQQLAAPSCSTSTISLATTTTGCNEGQQTKRNNKSSQLPKLTHFGAQKHSKSSLDLSSLDRSLRAPPLQQQQQQQQANDTKGGHPSSSGAFVTQIPTLISQSHAPIWPTRRQQKRQVAAELGAPINEKNPEVDVEVDEQQPPSSITIESSIGTKVEPEAAAADNNNKEPIDCSFDGQSELNEATEASRETSGDKAEQFSAANSSGELGGLQNDDKCDASSPNHQVEEQIEAAAAAAAASKSATFATKNCVPKSANQLAGEQTEVDEDDDDDLLRNDDSNEQQQRHRGQCQQPVCVVGAGQSSSHHECNQCKLFQNRLELLLNDRKQLEEQLVELEEMENDSRLMSQKLAKQVLSLEQQLEACQHKLHSTTDEESKLRFQNKRLQFELKQRQECIQQLQYQLNVFRSRAKSLLKLQKQQMEASKKGDLDGAVKGNVEQEQQEELESPSSAKRQASTSDDSDSAIDYCETRSKSSCDSSGQKSMMTMNELGVEANYAKSSASSDAGVYCGVSSSSVSNGSAEENDEHRKSILDRSTTSDNSSDEQVDLEEEEEEAAQTRPTGSLTSASSIGFSPASSCDESDHLQAETAVTNLETTEEAANSGSGNHQLTGRQQVQRKRISTARILRGIQLQQQQQQQPLNVSTIKSAEQATDDYVDQPIDSCNQDAKQVKASIDHLMEESTSLGAATDNENENDANQDEQKGASAGASQMTSVGQSKSAIELALRGVDELESNKSRTASEVLRLLVDARPTGEPTLRQSNAGQVEGNKQNGGDVSAAAATESGNNTTPVLSLLETTSGGEHVSNNQQPSIAAATTSGGGGGGGSRQVIDCLKHEIANLKLRLLQAQTLNDNLVLELKSNNSNNDYTDRPRGQQQQPPRVSYINRQQIPGEADLSSARDQARQRSVIYVNGLRASVNHHYYHHQYNHLAAGGSSTAPEDNHRPHMSQLDHSASASGSSQRPVNGGNPADPGGPVFAYEQQTNLNLLKVQLADREREMADFLRFLLDKLHFQHGRTFELANECQKIAMNALLASYSHQINFAHHNGAVMAGNQATWRQQEQQLYNQMSGRQQQQQPILDLGEQQQQQQQQQMNVMYPIRPPPRRRNRTTGQEPPFDLAPRPQQEADAIHEPSAVNEQQTGHFVGVGSKSIMANKELASIGQQQQQRFGQQTQPARMDTTNAVNQPKTSSTSALQVAKQTLFSLVPIYYSNNNNNNSTKTTPKEEAKPSASLVSCLKGSSSISVHHNERQMKNNEVNSQQQIDDLRQDANYDDHDDLDDGDDDDHHHQGWAPKSAKSKHDKPKFSNDIYATVNKQTGMRNKQAPPAATVLQIGPPNGRPIMVGQHQQQQQPFVSSGDQQQRPIHHNHCHHHHHHQLNAGNDQGHNNHIHLQQFQVTANNLKNSLSEDIERFRVHFNGQLLDLLTRQNWCESLITDKLKAIEQRRQPINLIQQQQQQQPQTTSRLKSITQINCHQQQQQQQQLPPFGHKNHLNQIGQPKHPADQQQLSSSNLKILHNITTKSVNVPMNCVSLNPNGHHHQQVGANPSRQQMTPAQPHDQRPHSLNWLHYGRDPKTMATSKITSNSTDSFC